MKVVGAQVWGVRREAWSLLVKKGRETSEACVESKKMTDVISDSAFAADLPTYLSRFPSPFSPSACLHTWFPLQCCGH